ncbi:MAG: Ni/Fe hydrogenase subunit alpha [Candidatus Omnitrophota bacterium]
MTSKTITIKPVTRIEGHANVRIDLDSKGNIQFAGLIVKEFRGFEKILTSMEVESMPLITARICGVCPVSHHLVSARTLDQVFQVESSRAGLMLREAMNLGGFIHSHTLALFVLSGPDLLLGPDSDSGKRNIVGLIEAAPDIAKKALALRTIGQRIVECIGGRGVHPVTAIAGGMSKALGDDERERLLSYARDALGIVKELSPVVKEMLFRLVDTFPEILKKTEDKTYYMGTVKNGKLNLIEGRIRVIDPSGKIVNEFDASDYANHIIEEPVDWSYMKPTSLKTETGEHTYQVNALARINVADGMETPEAQKELDLFRKKFGRPCHYIVMNHYARLIELIYACEKLKQLLEDPAITGAPRTEVPIGIPQNGIAHIEAPRGTLFHDYTVNEDGIVQKANLVIATQQNYKSINQAIRRSAEYFMNKSNADLENSVEFFIRTYDPCLSCATHAVGKIPMNIFIYRNGELEQTIRRS